VTRAPHSPLEIVIVAYGDPATLEACLAALEGVWKPVVVDNSSLPATRALAGRFGAVYVDPGRNLGFAGGVNTGLAARTDLGADVLLLNPDAMISPDGIRRLHAALCADPRLAAVGPEQVAPGGGDRARVSWPVPTPAGAWIEALGFGAKRSGRQFVIGSVLLLNSEALTEIGPLDERFFLYAEETDWEIRAMDAGWRVAVCSDVVATHIGAGTGGDPRRRETYFHASHERLIRKHYGGRGWLSYRAANVAGAAVRSVALRGAGRDKARYRLYLFSRGPCKAERAMVLHSAHDAQDSAP
jgi:GT2 family glycosyltransferase